ncbi:hypothetical protein TrispH2_010043, partial [Trichoplax sp. H2]
YITKYSRLSFTLLISIKNRFIEETIIEDLNPTFIFLARIVMLLVNSKDRACIKAFDGKGMFTKQHGSGRKQFDGLLRHDFKIQQASKTIG